MARKKAYNKDRPSRNPFDVVGDAAAGVYSGKKRAYTPNDATKYYSDRGVTAAKKRRAAASGAKKVTYKKKGR